mgnify:FL=1
MGEPKFAQHAFAADLHIETRYVLDHWEWEVFRVKTRERLGSGRAESLQAAKKTAERVGEQAGFSGVLDWKDIAPGPPASK